jgi:DNA-binding NtrC family response regulator
VGHRQTEPIVLIVDDEPSICDLFARVLASAGLFPVVAHSAESALSLIKRGLTPNAILLDLKMPGMGGLAFLLQVRADPLQSDIPVAIVTGDCTIPAVVCEAARALNTEIHFKPLEMDAILGLTQRLLESTVGDQSPRA